VNQPEDVVYQTLLESTKAIPWKIDWESKTFAWLGPQIEALLGWPAESWKTVHDWAERMHPDDRQWLVDFRLKQSLEGKDHQADYRALHRDGSYLWIRDVAHVVRRPDETPEALIGFMFDISERKATEEKLLRLQKELEEQSFKDGLTGIANRRRFDQVIEEEWAAARRTQRPLSLVLVDIDFFKQYNDHFGHLQGDECLKRVAHALKAGTRRPRDFLGRYGGEEFVLILPETNASGADQVAELCRDAVATSALPHPLSTVARTVSISLGAGTIVPENDGLIAFIEEVDQRLYRAKERGRNTVVNR
jgi:diguanylate cyclase (GGDEF)-like protein/PAS domain S-box-containing protein